MLRQLLLQYPGAIYPVMSRGNRRGKILPDNVDRQDFIKTLAEAFQNTGWQVHACCLMPNHFHLTRAALSSYGRAASNLSVWKGRSADPHGVGSRRHRRGHYPAPL